MINTEEKIKVYVYGVFFILFVVGIFLYPYFKVKAFNRVSEKKVTYWDAVFLDLRVEAK